MYMYDQIVTASLGHFRLHSHSNPLEKMLESFGDVESDFVGRIRPLHLWQQLVRLRGSIAACHIRVYVVYDFHTTGHRAENKTYFSRLDTFIRNGDIETKKCSPCM